jgi:hypothetical protein
MLLTPQALHALTQKSSSDARIAADAAARIVAGVVTSLFTN